MFDILLKNRIAPKNAQLKDTIFPTMQCTKEIELENKVNKKKKDLENDKNTNSIFRRTKVS